MGIKNHMDDDYIFVEPFCGSASVSYLVFSILILKKSYWWFTYNKNWFFYNNMKMKIKEIIYK